MTNPNDIAKKDLRGLYYAWKSEPGAYDLHGFLAMIDANYTLTKNKKPEDVPEAARAMFTCFHKFEPANSLNASSIAVYCAKCGTTVEGEKIIPPVAYFTPKEEVKECSCPLGNKKVLEECITGKWIVPTVLGCRVHKPQEPVKECFNCNGHGKPNGCLKCGKGLGGKSLFQGGASPSNKSTGVKIEPLDLKYNIDVYDVARKQNQLTEAFNAHINK